MGVTQEVLQNYALEGSVNYCERYGSGHINETYLVKTDKKDYILQKINNTIFKDVPALMANIAAVSKHLSDKGFDERHNLTLVPTKDGKNYVLHRDGSYWRVYKFVTDSISLNLAETPEDFYNSALGFGTFQSLLYDFDADVLSETIPHFHDTPDRYRQLHEAIANNKAGRLDNVKEELEFALSQEKDASMLMDLLKSGDLPLRVTHNDTKLNNVLLDAATRKPICIIDLDTVMPCLVANDFGDSIRFGASTALEDEENLNKVELSLDLFDVYTKGFLEGCGKHLKDKEIDTLPYGAKIMTLECGVRFLTDYLNGDTYFRVHKPDHNLIRCRTQFKLVKRINENLNVLHAIIQKYRQTLH